jgi:serine/threonine protein kinase
VATYGKQDDGERAASEAPESPLWPSAADGRSGMRGKDDVEARKEPRAPYRLLAPMGSSAYGRAYRALHIGPNREVALHYLPLPEENESAHARELPLLVAKCAQLSHHNVISVEEYGRDPETGAHFVVSEPLDGVSLAAVLADLETLPLARALSITLQMGRALRAAHKLNIVHGALSPGNVRLVPSEQGERVRVVGFGALSLAPPGVRSEPLDESAYSAPECRAGKEPDARSDVFSIASLLFHMLSGSPPPVGDEVPRLSLHSVDPVPRELEELLSRCLDVRPEARVSDAVSFVRELRAITRNLGLGWAGASALSSESSLPPAELPPPEGESSGSLFGVEPTFGGRGGAVWILAGLILALAAVWLLWDASSRGLGERPPNAAERRGE